MNRWTSQALLACSLFAASAAMAQSMVRNAPADVQPALIAISATPPDVTVNGQPTRLSPGARIRGLNNLLVLPASIAGQTIPTVYRKDAAGLVHEVWILTPEEYERVGGTNLGDPNGYKRFYELLELIFGARAGVLR